MTPINIQEYVAQNTELLFRTLRELCAIPAPSGMEDERAAYCKTWLENAGAEGVYIDSAKNTVFPLSCDGKDTITAVVAHTDTVFPDTEPMPYLDDGEKIFCPGVGDDTASLSVLLVCAKDCIEQNLRPREGLLFVCNSCEEGLGNLKGIKQIMQDYAGRITRVYTFDETYDELVTKCVGSHRYELTLQTEGGHSFNNFGNRNAIIAAAQLIQRLSACDIPQNGQGKTTFNVGTITGGTSVNTIAQNATFTYEYRSDSREDLQKMQQFFQTTVEQAQKENIAQITVTMLGERPCGGQVDEKVLQEMIDEAVAISQKHSGIPCACVSGSTDCNIPMSLGVPAICVGGYLGNGAHTREEKVRIDSIAVGLKIAAELILSYFQ